MSENPQIVLSEMYLVQSDLRPCAQEREDVAFMFGLLERAWLSLVTTSTRLAIWRRLVGVGFWWIVSNSRSVRLT